MGSSTSDIDLAASLLSVISKSCPQDAYQVRTWSRRVWIASACDRYLPISHHMISTLGWKQVWGEQSQRVWASLFFFFSFFTFSFFILQKSSYITLTFTFRLYYTATSLICYIIWNQYNTFCWRQKTSCGNGDCHESSAHFVKRPSWWGTKTPKKPESTSKCSLGRSSSRVKELFNVLRRQCLWWAHSPLHHA